MNSPQSISRPRVPIMIGGGGEKKTLRLVAQYADACNVFGSPEAIARKYAILAEHCAAVGRDPDEIERSTLQNFRISADGAGGTETPARIVDRFGELSDAGRPARHRERGQRHRPRARSTSSAATSSRPCTASDVRPPATSRYPQGVCLPCYDERMTDKSPNNGSESPDPFGGLTISMIDAPEAPSDAASIPMPGGPTTFASGEGRVDAKLVIVGSGPAGLTAAIYAARANLEPVVLAGSAPGGQLMLTSDVENYPGFPDGIQGPDLMAAFRGQAARFGSQIVDVDIDRVDFSERPFRLWARGTEYRAQSVIVATGASALWLGLDSRDAPARPWRVGVCDLRRVLLPGPRDRGRRRRRHGARGGDLPDPLRDQGPPVPPARHVPGLEDHDRPGEGPSRRSRSTRTPRSTRSSATAKVDGVRLRDTVTGEETSMALDGLFIAIGYRPNTEAFRDWLEVDEAGYLVVHDETGSKVDGVFIAGDVHDHRYRQAVTAAADGCKAAIDAERWLESQGITETATAAAW